MSIKVYLHIELSGYPEKTSKLTIPKSWVATKAVTDVITLFLDGYNAKEAAGLEPLKVECMHLSSAMTDGINIYSDSPIQNSLEDRTDYFLLPGEYIKPISSFKSDNKHHLKCKNYGCNKVFIEEENNDTACHFHALPPFFRDTVKGWQCCRDIKAYDWEEFQAIPACCVGRHSLEEKESIFQSSPTVAAAEAATATSAHPKSIADYNISNPTAITAASAAVKAITRKSTRKPDGTARCLRKGCQMTFNYSENASDACRYHIGQAVFHDTMKYWSCCDGKKCCEFDDFMKVPGCATGYHDDGVIDL